MPPSGYCKLEERLNNWTHWQLMDEYWECTTCPDRKPAHQRMQIMKCPDKLVIQLKRFNNYLQKVSTTVEFPMRNLNIQTCLDENIYFGKNRSKNSAYHLYTTVNHKGEALESGHYTAFCKSDKRNQWYCYDDERVVPVSASAVRQEGISSAYLLFYAKS